MSNPAAPTHWPVDWTADPLWFEDDAFWTGVQTALFSAERWKEAETEVVQALALLGVAPPDQILDMACGPGRHLLPLASLGYRVTGIDRTASFLAQAQATARARGLHVQTRRADLRSLSASSTTVSADRRQMDFDETPIGPFDGAIWLDSSLGYSPSVSDDLAALHGVRALLRPGARLVIETLGLECALGSESPASDGPRAAGPHLLEEAERESVDGQSWLIERRITATGWMEVRWGQVNGLPTCYRHRLYTAPELADLVQQAGMRKVCTYGSLRGDRYGPDASTLVVVSEV